jgi:acyl dehydratase
MRYFEDLAVGQKHAYGEYVVDREEMIRFAAAYDPQPFHLSDEGGAKTLFGRMVASGWHTAAMSMRMNVAELRDGETLIAAGIEDMKFLRPVHAGDVLRCEAEIIDTRSSRSNTGVGFARIKIVVFNQDNVPVLSYVGNQLHPRRPT